MKSTLCSILLFLGVAVNLYSTKSKSYVNWAALQVGVLLVNVLIQYFGTCSH